MDVDVTVATDGEKRTERVMLPVQEKRNQLSQYLYTRDNEF